MSNELTVKMSAWLAHVRAASEQGLTIVAYAAAQGLSATSMYQAKSQLMKVGAWPRSSAPRAQVRSPSRRKRKTPASRFVPVRVTAAVSCRLSHVSGWTLTCDDLPSAQWLMALVRDAVLPDAVHAAA
jgi:hypothetical protein